jgi:hypothetical protein
MRAVRAVNKALAAWWDHSNAGLFFRAFDALVDRFLVPRRKP